MTARLIAAPAIEPVSLAEMKLWLRLDTADEDALVTGLIAAARALVEREARRVLITQGWRIALDGWPPGPVVLPVGPVQTVSAVRVFNASAVPTTINPASYRFDASSDPARLWITGAVTWPELIAGGIEIDITCGYGSAAADVPEPLKLAIRLLVARWYEHRGDDAPEVPAMPADIAPLVSVYRRPRL